MPRRSAVINVMVRAADRAARGLKRDFGEVENLQVSRKGPSDFVSAADLRAEETLHQELAKARPGFGFLMEESGTRHDKPGAEQRWIVDPLDGTTNFLHGLPHFAISIALEERGEIIAGVVYDPIKEEVFWAEKGIGAYLGGKRLRVSGRRSLSDCLLATGIPFQGRGDAARFTSELAGAMAATAGVRRWGTASLDLAYVAAGRFDGFWEWGLSAWDFAAGWLLVREAGGFVTEMDGRSLALDSGSLLAANGELHPDLMKLLKG